MATRPLLVLFFALVLGCVPLRDPDERADAGGQPDAALQDSGPADATPDGGPVECGSGSTISVWDVIDTDTTWSCANTYVLERPIWVRGAVLTVEAGTRVEARPNGALIVERTAQLRSLGTASAPVVFTAAGDTPRARGLWGGVILLGDAPTDRADLRPLEDIEGMTDGDTRYGGRQGAHSCGTITYTRIELAGGRPTGATTELDGLTLAGCGTGTVIDYVQVHASGDDAVMVYGGGVALGHLVITHPREDGLDWDEGWVGLAQFVVIQLDAGSEQAFEGTSSGSRPLIANATLVGDAGPVASDAMRLARGTAGTLTHLLVVGFGRSVADVQDTDTVAWTATPPDGTELLRIQQSVFFDVGPPLFDLEEGADDDDEGFLEGEYFMAAVFGNTEGDPMLGDRTSRAAPDFRPSADASVLDREEAPSDAARPGLVARLFDSAVTYAGAIAPGGEDWTAGWTEYPSLQ